MTEEQKKAAEAALAQQAEARKKQEEEEAKKAREELEKVMNTCIDPDEASKKIAEINVHRAQLGAYRSSLGRQQMQIDIEFSNIAQQLAKLDCDEAVIRRQMLNTKES